MNNEKNHICKVCSSNINKDVNTCSISCGMIYRFLKNKTQNISHFLDKTNFAESLSLPARWHLYKNGIDTIPKCQICTENIVIFKGKFSETCSREHSKLLTKQKLKQRADNQSTCELCGIKHKSQSCTKIIKTIKNMDVQVQDVINGFIKFTNLSYYQKAILLKNGYNDTNLPKCKVCLKNHVKTNSRRLVLDACSTKCANLYKIKKAQHKEVIEYTELLDLNIHERYKIFNSSMPIIKCGTCEKWFPSYRSAKHCSTKCEQTLHFKNYGDYNANFVVDNFVDVVFDVDAFMKYFNVSYTTTLRFKVKHGIVVPNKNSTEHRLFKELNIINSIQNDRTLIKPLEIDILSHEHKFGIEYDGLVWHSSGISKHSMFNNPNKKCKHLMKTELMEEKEYQLFHIFENEWMLPRTKNIWKSIIRNKMNLCNSINSSECTVKEIDADSAYTFLEKNHLDGSCRASVRIGLYHSDKLVSVMVFRRNKESFKIVRLCSKSNIQVDNNKLLNYFIQKFNPSVIVGISNRRWCNGEVYRAMGFTFIKHTSPNHFYFKGSDSIKRLFKSNVSSKIMYVNGHRKIYDSGNSIYELIL